MNNDLNIYIILIVVCTVVVGWALFGLAFWISQDFKKINNTDDFISKETIIEPHNVNNDTISRQAAIEALGEKPVAWSKGEYERGLQNQCGYDVSAIKQLPSAQPEHIRGHWIRDRSWSEGVGMGESYGHYWKCDKCGHLEQGDWGECGCNFCSNCGSDNREVTT